MNTIQAKKHYTDEYAFENFAGTLLTDKDYDLVVSDDCVVLKPDGTPLLIYRKGVIPLDECRAAYTGLRKAAIDSDSANRGMATGNGRIIGGKSIGEVSSKRVRLKKTDGTISNTGVSLMSTDAGKALKKSGGKLQMRLSDGTWADREAKDIPSGVAGYMDAAGRYPYCRLTAFNINHPDMFANSLPMVRSVDGVFRESFPERYANQKRVVEQTSTDFYISGTVFTTLTINLNFQTAVHKDMGDLKEGFGVMAALRSGKFDGCYTCFPQYRVAADMRTGNVLMADVHEWHGNTPIHPQGKYERLSLVFYYREGIKECGSATEELEKAQRTRGLTYLTEWKK